MAAAGDDPEDATEDTTEDAAPSDWLTRAAIRETAARIRPHVRRTPLLAADMGDFGGPAAPVLLKLEHLQHAGSFKARGAFAALTSGPPPAAGVVAASGGNHGAAVAYAARRLGVPANIFVPEVTSPAKIARIESYGARLVVGGARYADALAASEAFVSATGARAVHAYDQRETLLGQGTLGAEIEADAPDLDTLLVAVGGGGLIGGIAAWYGGRVRIVAVEPEGAPTLHRALAAGAPVAAHWIADRQSGPLLLRFGNEAQRELILNRIVKGECFFAIGMSEPDSGSDLASLRSSGTKVEGGWRVNGRKIWTSGAHLCQYMIALIRTAPRDDTARHDGLSQFLIDLESDGIT
ncbi:MAG: pyridoxal-phosphate dependent enzyme, partial [Alphaproteobacteria bacterium]